MSWETYSDRLLALNGKDDLRESRTERASRHFTNHLPASLSCQNVFIDGKEQRLVIINRDNIDEKAIHTLPGEELFAGASVFWNGYWWLVTEVSGNNTIYTSGIMEQCNYELRWVNKRGEIISRHCVIDDGTKYLVGEKIGASGFLTVGDTRMVLVMSRDEETVLLGRGERFIVDDPLSPNKIAYELTKPNKTSNVYNGHGVFRHIIRECDITDDDNTELMIANYYSRIAKDNIEETGGTTSENEGESGYRIEINCDKSMEQSVVIGEDRAFEILCFNGGDPCSFEFEAVVNDEGMIKITEVNENIIAVKALNKTQNIGKSARLLVYNDEYETSDSINIKIAGWL